MVQLLKPVLYGIFHWGRDFQGAIFRKVWYTWYYHPNISPGAGGLPGGGPLRPRQERGGCCVPQLYERMREHVIEGLTFIKWLLYSCLIGVIVGLVAVAFHEGNKG